MGFLKETKIELMDGAEYTFTALPFNRKSAGFFRVITNEESSTGDTLEAFLGLVYLSLGASYTEEQIDGFLDKGLVPFPGAKGEKEAAIMAQFQEALRG